MVIVTTIYAQNLYFPPLTGSEWETMSPDSLGWCADSLNSLNDYLESKSTKAFIILKDGKIVVEWYFGYFNSSSIWYWASAGKSLEAFLIGIAQQEGFLNIDDVTSDYLGTGWTICPPEKELLIKIKHQITLTTGLNDGVEDPNCTLNTSLEYLVDAGTRWAYHTATTTLLGNVIEEATGISKNDFTITRLNDHTGIDGTWIQMGYDNVFYSNARSMARFGLLILNNAAWEDNQILNDPEYFDQMVNTSQEFNLSYGYLWWLNGKGSYMLPQTQFVFNTDLIPEAPDDLIAALGRNDQKIYVVPSQNLVVIRMGNSAGQPHYALSSFDNHLWRRIMDLGGNVSVNDNMISPEIKIRNYPNPFNPTTTIEFSVTQTSSFVTLEIYNLKGQKIRTFQIPQSEIGNLNSVIWNGTDKNNKPVSGGIYFYRLKAGNSFSQTKRMLLLK